MFHHAMFTECTYSGSPLFHLSGSQSEADVMAFLVCCVRFCMSAALETCPLINLSAHGCVGKWFVLHTEPHFHHTHGGERCNRDDLVFCERHSERVRSKRPRCYAR